MSSNDRSGPHERRARNKPAKRQGNTNRRIRRTRERLGAALIALIEEKANHEVTIREVLDLAKVGRSTFIFNFKIETTYS